MQQKTAFMQKTVVGVIVLAKNQQPVSIRCQNCGFTVATRKKLNFDKQKVSKWLFNEPQGAPPQGRAVGVG